MQGQTGNPPLPTLQIGLCGFSWKVQKHPEAPRPEKQLGPESTMKTMRKFRILFLQSNLIRKAEGGLVALQGPDWEELQFRVLSAHSSTNDKRPAFSELFLVLSVH